mmetsp:Transcript_10668/g.23201  ORF Transcript_10668/g.23201 Transcript_10668/m.23201 type:complete len:221 (+) Transcript_10668:608-1270(+)
MLCHVRGHAQLQAHSGRRCHCHCHRGSDRVRPGGQGQSGRHAHHALHWDDRRVLKGGGAWPPVRDLARPRCLRSDDRRRPSHPGLGQGPCKTLRGRACDDGHPARDGLWGARRRRRRHPRRRNAQIRRRGHLRLRAAALSRPIRRARCRPGRRAHARRNCRALPAEGFYCRDAARAHGEGRPKPGRRRVAEGVWWAKDATGAVPRDAVGRYCVSRTRSLQ